MLYSRSVSVPDVHCRILGMHLNLSHSLITGCFHPLAMLLGCIDELKHISFQLAGWAVGLQLKLWMMRGELKGAVEDAEPVAGYACRSCGATYTSMDAVRLVDHTGEFVCEDCGWVHSGFRFTISYTRG